MNQFDQFQQAIQIKQIEENLFSFIPDKKYSVGNTPNGGYLFAIMHKALVSVLPHTCSFNSNIFFLDRTESSEAFLEVKVIRESRGTSMGEVELIQHDNVTCKMSGLCTDLDKISGYSDLQSPFPKIKNEAARSKFIKMDYDSIEKGFTPEFIKQLELSIFPDHVWWKRDDNNINHEARCSAYVELKGGIPDQFILSYLTDIFPPVVINKYGPLGWIPTLNMTTNIRQLPETSVLFMDGIATDLNKGYFEQNVKLWDLNENLVATSSQVAKILKSNERLGIAKE